MEKNKIRKEMLEKRLKMHKKTVENNSLLITNKLIKILNDIDFNNIFCYVSFDNEVNTKELIKYYLNKKKVLVPKIIEKSEMQAIEIKSLKQLEKNNFGILEPRFGDPYEKDKIDIAIFPAVAFDLEMNRIGFGAGYYDKFFKENNAIKIGICHDFQIIKKIKTYGHDVSLDLIVSEKQIIGYLEKSKSKSS